MALFKQPQRRKKSQVNYRSHSLTPLYILNSQIKNAENKTSSTAIPSPDGVSSSSKPSASGTPTQKPPTTTYKAHTSSYKSTPSYTSYTNRSDTLLTEQDRLRLRAEFFATYDVMTGIRIAATLGGFFFLMVFLIVYKSRSHSNRALRVS